MKDNLFIKILILPLLLISFSGHATIVAAEKIEVSIDGNGSNSENAVSIESKTETKVEQSNEANIENNVAANADTGNNEANNNSGDVNISTGDITVITDVSNENININHAESCNCQENSTTLNVNGNGGGSNNATNVNKTANVAVSQKNTANITNNVGVNANTGTNSANNNGSNIVIKTGNIGAVTNVENSNINSNYIKGFSPSSNSININISGNASDSDNFINISSDDLFVYVNENTMNIVNNIFHNLNTGGNQANGNLGDVAIITGGIESIINVLNQGSSNHIDLKCDVQEEPESPILPSPNPGSNNNGVGGGSVMGASANGNGQPGLPATGNLGLFLLTLFLGIMLVSGWYLRTTSGVSPPRA